MFIPEGVIKVKGTPYEQGKQQGEKIGDIIKENVINIKQSIAKSNVKEKYYNELLEENLGFIEKAEPDVYEEMKGISDGAKIDFNDIAIINIPIYFMLDIFPDECSSILARGNATFDGNTYLIKNRDMKLPTFKQIVLERGYINGDNIVEVNGAGIVTYPGNGINKYSLAISTTGVWSKKIPVDVADISKTDVLINVHFILESCKNVDEAIKFLNNIKRMNGINLLIADRSKAVAVEVTRDKIVLEEDEDGILVRTNHYLSEELRRLNKSPKEYQSTYKRLDRIKNFLHKKQGNIKFQDMLEIASDHENAPYSCICRHRYGADESEAKTVSSSLIVLEDKQVWTALCNPCEALKLSYV
ncbi:MAG: hypothetical protein XD91_1624 [Clostridiales bacterium 38_11]|nr:MAG: hypothetical protein XD91_1624 [Clostridiales bacterium 38_11]